MLYRDANTHKMECGMRIGLTRNIQRQVHLNTVVCLLVTQKAVSFESSSANVSIPRGSLLHCVT